ncbi:hypothetical protein [Moorena sp. SIOASIH]|uniref:hypothetical protein n=1 Tax=Moorena sp. SIOASIH TaxID=2607817 RepID=UPI0025DE69A7|nr:hypothetical protein [Moorena sp. SIOASIH]
MGETTAVAHGGNPQDRTASPRPRCLPKTALPPQDRNGAFSVGELNSPRVAPLHRFLASIEMKYPTSITPRPCQHSELARPS